MKIKNIKEYADKIIDNVSKVMIGEEEKTRLIIATMISRGHVLLEDVPGTGKTMLAKSIARSIDGNFSRIQFTPDLMPADVTGMNVFNRQKSEFELIKGPVFTDVLLADEINRTTPRTQSSLLEAMEERQVTIDGETLELSDGFLVIATENPLETAGTYPLPEAQLDRFMVKLSMEAGSKEKELAIIDRFISGNPLEEISSVCSVEDIDKMAASVKEVFVHNCVRDYIVNIVLATRTDSGVKQGVSSRGVLALLKLSQSYAALKGKNYVDPDTVRYLAPFVLGHRIKYNSGFGNYNQIIEKTKNIVASVDVPVENWEEK